MARNPATWTVMVYLAGDNNLTTECMFALREMKDAVLCENFNVIAQFDPSDPYLPSHRYEINRDTSQSLYTDIIDRARYRKRKGEVKFRKESRSAIELAALRRSVRNTGRALEKASLTGNKSNKVVTDDTDTGSPITLYNFISFCVQEYPADHYLVVLSGHAGGTERDYLLKDESSAGSLTFNELKQVFKRVKDDLGKPIDMVGMDNCLMSMAEICYELRGLTEVVVGCESFSPASGWPYKEILERLCNDSVNPTLHTGKSGAAEAAKAIVEEYVNYYSTYWMAGLSVTQSALNVNKVEQLQREINKLAQVMEKELLKTQETAPRRRRFENSLLLAHWEAQSYNGEQFVDVYDFCDCLEHRVDSKAVALQCRRLKKFIESQFVLSSCYSGPTYQYSYGVSMYFPWAEVAPSYWNLDFIKETDGAGWGSFLRTYTQVTRRLPRGVTRKTRLFADRSTTSLDSSLSAAVIDHRMIDDRMIDDRMIDDRMINNRMIDDRMIDDRMGSSRNRIHSMRNPPNMFLPDKCIRDRRDAMECQRILRLR